MQFHFQISSSTMPLTFNNARLRQIGLLSTTTTIAAIGKSIYLLMDEIGNDHVQTSSNRRSNTMVFSFISLQVLFMTFQRSRSSDPYELFSFQGLAYLCWRLYNRRSQPSNSAQTRPELKREASADGQKQSD